VESISEPVVVPADRNSCVLALARAVLAATATLLAWSRYL